MSLPYHKPPPYERPNWDSMNEGQKRYAMEQYNLALVRRGAKFTLDDQKLPETESTSSIETPSKSNSQNPIEALDEIDRLLDIIDTIGTNQETSQTSRTSPDNQSQPSTSQQVHGTTMNDTPPATPVRSGTSHTTPAEGESAAKRLRMDSATSGSALPGTGGNIDGMKDKGMNQDGSRGIANIVRGIHTPSYHWTFRKKWKFLSFGVADQIFSEALTSGTSPAGRWCLTTSLVNIPWEYAFFYLSPAEMNRLREFHGVFASKAHIKIYQYNPRVAFQTGDTTSTQATLNQNKFTRVAIGLRSNANLWGSDRDYVFSDTEPMKPTGFETTGNNTGQKNRLSLVNALYGGNNDSPTTFPTFPPAVCTGAEVGLTRYYTVYTTTKENIGFPQYNKFCTEYNAMDMVGQEVTNQTYNFEYAPLHERARNFQDNIYLAGDAPATLPTSLGNTIVLLDGNKIEGPRAKEIPSRGTHANAIHDDTLKSLAMQRGGAAGNVNNTNMNFDNVYYKFPMEQNSVYQEINRKPMDYANQQSVHVGVRAVPKLGTLVNDIQPSSWLDTQMYWTVEATLEVNAADPFTYPLGNVADIAARAQCVTMTTNETPIPIVTTLDLPYQYGRKRAVDNAFTV